MRRRRVLLLVLPLVVALVAVTSALRLCFAAEHPARNYPSYAEAKAAGAIGPRGWIPSWVPEAAYDIHDQHAIDSSARCIRFSLPAGKAEELRRVLEPLKPDEIESLDASCRFDAGWWFEGLVQQQPANDHALNAELYRGPAEAEQPVFVAIDRVSPQVFIWSR